MGAKSRNTGEITEQAALIELRRMGALVLQRISTPSVPVRLAGGKVGKKYTGKVVGDIVGIWPGGRGILLEAKSRTRNGRYVRPTPSCFEDHQRDALVAWGNAGGSALVAYLYQGDTGTVCLIEDACNFFAKPTGK